MEKLKSFRITALHMEGFKSYSQPTDLTFRRSHRHYGRQRTRQEQHRGRHCLCCHRSALLRRAPH